MSDDPLDAIRKMAAVDQEARLQNHIQANSRAQIRSRNVRRGLRYALLGLTVLGIGLLSIAGNNDLLIGSGVLCLAALFPVGLTLFFMGGIAGPRTRRMLTQRERDLLDN